MANKILICKPWFTTVDMHVSNMEFLSLKLFKGEAYKLNILCRRELGFFFSWIDVNLYLLSVHQVCLDLQPNLEFELRSPKTNELL